MQALALLDLFSLFSFDPYVSLKSSLCIGEGETDNVTKEALTGTARVKNVTILDQVWCDDRLKQLRLGSEREDLEHGFVVFPRS